MQVRKTMREMGFVPRPPRVVSRRTRSDAVRDPRTSRVAILTVGQSSSSWLSMPIIASFVAEVTAAAREADLDVLLDEMPDLLVPSRLVRRREIGGAIVLVDSDVARQPAGQRCLEALSRELPIVWAMGAHVGPLQIDHVTVDNMGVGYVAADYLLEQGCERPAVICGLPPSWAFVRSRVSAFQYACFDAQRRSEVFVYGVSERDASLFPAPVHVHATLDDAVRAFATRAPAFDGLFALTDHQMTLLHPKLLEHGLAPGRSLRLISCDNERDRFIGLDAPPGTIDLNVGEIARRAIRRLRLRIHNHLECPVLIHVPPVLHRPEPPRL
jgi:DNA-binding LacI/PurR family transcriptional regulator